MLILPSFTFGLSAATAAAQHGGGRGGRGGGGRGGSGGGGHGVGGIQGGGDRGGDFDSGGVVPISNPADWCHSNPYYPWIGGVTKRDDPFSAFLGQGQVVVRKVTKKSCPVVEMQHKRVLIQPSKCQCIVKPEDQESFTLTRTRTVGDSSPTRTVRVTATSTTTTTTTTTTTPLGSKSQPRAGAPQCDPNSELGGQGVGGCS
ncbi:hypothetical protein BJ166DRAFT_502166 [Pestalotiopsis sp. NC0098]|nr:hypothetical protein BJ166DRAFT_502166 [Pestalotiopsis sp. NC0098]